MLRRALVSHFSSSCYPIYSLTLIYQPYHPKPSSTLHHIYPCVLQDLLYLQDTLLHLWSMPSSPLVCIFAFLKGWRGLYHSHWLYACIYTLMRYFSSVHEGFWAGIDWGTPYASGKYIFAILEAFIAYMTALRTQIFFIYVYTGSLQKKPARNTDGWAHTRAHHRRTASSRRPA